MVNKFSQMLASILVNAIYAMVNYPIVLISTLLAPFSLLIVITFVTHGSLLPVAIGGALIMTMIGSGTSLQQDLSHLKNDFKLQDMIVSSPTTSKVYLIGMSISEIVYSLPAIIVLVILAAFYIQTTAIGYAEIFAVMVIIFIFSVSLGFLLSTITSDVIQSWAFSGIIATILSALPPVYYPITYVPFPFRYIVYLSPATYAAEIVQNVTGLVTFSSTTLLIDWIVIIAVAIIMTYIAVKKSKWTED
ncbi:MAG: ABC transporter permease [Candidatus Micrarchaeota archaeon]|nr:ABC transporter permease [Candidatus Micrarchaeota archaeon]MDE1859173.1 ABC transporter permease [Candidatus Micrarchaeota archaeon]